MTKPELTEKIALSFKEFCLIMALRNKYHDGKVVIQMRDSRVVRVLKAFESDELEEPHLTKDKF